MSGLISFISIMKHLFLLICLIIGVTLEGQRIPTVYFESGPKVLKENINAFISQPDIPENDIIDGFYYRYIQFSDIPTLSEQRALVGSGLEIIEYLPDYTYLVGIPVHYEAQQLRRYDIRSVVKTDVEDKLDQRLRLTTWPAWANGSAGQVKVTIKTYPLISKETFTSRLRESGVTFDDAEVHFPFVFTEIPAASFYSIASLPFIQYIEPGPDPGEPEDTGGRTLQRANVINNQLPGGLRYDGSGVNVMVRDDGVVGPHIDFQGRLVDVSEGIDAGIHGDGVAGVMAGAGNLDPTNRGAASGAGVYADDYVSTFTDDVIDQHINNGVVITNSSFSNGCNAGYTTTTQTVDQQMIDNPNLMHVFSAGNANNSDCGYGAGDQWGNITGGHKVGKNVMAVANLMADGTLANSSSRGPAHDGRIKPDISAHGEDQISTSTNNTYQTFGGTSSAAPTMAGSYAQLYQAYKEINGSSLPNTGFLKAVVLNSATDMGNIGPDFKYGWGRIDANQGLKTISYNQYLASNIAQGSNNTHALTIPAGVAEARVMVYWVDPAGAVNTSKALVNDLDLHILDPSTTRHDPWLLNPTAHPDSLDLPATKGVDTLNNMEQVSITSPSAGAYMIKVDGTSVPMGTQDYYVVWTFLYDEILVTYPLGGEGLVPGETERVHWDAVDTTGTFDVEYSTNNGSSWTTISSGLSGDTRLVNWTVPGAVTSEALVRVTRGAQSDTSMATFSIIDVPQNISFANQCQTGMDVSWDPVTGADEYIVLLLGDKYMEPVDTVSVLTYTFNNLTTDQTHWLSVQAINNQGAQGRRANAVSYYADPGFSNCPNTIEIIKSVNTTEVSAGEIITYTVLVTNYYGVDITNVIVVDTLSPYLNYVAGSLTCGSASNDTLSIDFGTIMPDSTMSCSFDARTDPLSFGQVKLNDDFEMGVGAWTVDNIDGPKTWSLSTFNANSPTHSYFTPNRGQEQNTQAIVTDPISIPEDAVFSFYHLYNLESGWDGGLVEISTDNGTSWTDLGSLMTQNGYNSTLGNGANPNIANRLAFTGNSNGFLKTVIDLSNYADSLVLIRFLFGEDNSLGAMGWYIDDVKLSASFSIHNQACAIYDQGGQLCSDKIETAILNCADDISTYVDANGALTLDTTDLSTPSFGAGADTVYFLIRDYRCAGIAAPFNNAAVAVSGTDTTYCSFKVISVIDTFPTDTIPPVLNCADITIYLDSMGTYTLTAADSMAMISSASDNTVIASISFSQSSFSCMDMPDTMIMATATDVHCLSTVCAITVTVMDTIAPVLVCNGLAVDLSMDKDTVITTDHILTAISDNCTLDTTFLNIDTLNCTHAGTDVPITLTAIDASGNEATCIVEVSVTDTHGYCCPDTLIVGGMPVPTLDYYGSDLIRSDGQIGIGVPVNLRSQTILLDTTFTVDNGGALQVINEDCNN